MPRKARDERLDTRTARLGPKPRREPYWRTIQEGRAMGYRRLAGGKAGTWIARHYEPAEGRKYQSLGAADDMLTADGVGTLTWAQAQARAQKWWQSIERDAGRVVEPVTVREAMDAYLADYRARGGKAEAAMLTTIKAHILPALGDVEVARLTFARIREWTVPSLPPPPACGPRRRRRRTTSGGPRDRRRTVPADPPRTVS